MKAELTGLTAAIIALLGVFGVVVTDQQAVSVTAGVTAVVAIGFAVYKRLDEWRNGKTTP